MSRIIFVITFVKFSDILLIRFCQWKSIRKTRSYQNVIWIFFNYKIKNQTIFKPLQWQAKTVVKFFVRSKHVVFNLKRNQYRIHKKLWTGGKFHAQQIHMCERNSHLQQMLCLFKEKFAYFLLSGDPLFTDRMFPVRYSHNKVTRKQNCEIKWATAEQNGRAAHESFNAR